MSRPSSILYPQDSAFPLKTDDTIIAQLVATSTIQRLNKSLVSASEASGWVDAVRRRTLQLIQSGQFKTYKQVMNKLMGEVWEDFDERRYRSGVNAKNVNGVGVNGERPLDLEVFEKRAKAGEFSKYHH